MNLANRVRYWATHPRYFVSRVLQVTANRIYASPSTPPPLPPGQLNAVRALEQAALERFYGAEVGRAYKMDRAAKKALVDRIRAVGANVPSATPWIYHIVLATAILRIPPETPGDVIECGCWKGSSTASLSLVCDIVGRKLVVCDSFQGLPEDEGALHVYPHLSVYGYYKPGIYEGRLEEVRQNIANFGRLEVCEFLPGFFDATLPALTRPIAFAFFDVDLASSMRTCIHYVWPLLADGGFIYTDDSCDMEVVRIWFDAPWWEQTLGVPAPGYVGSGCGLPLHPDYASLGYTRKTRNPAQAYNRISWLYYPDEDEDKAET